MAEMDVPRGAPKLACGNNNVSREYLSSQPASTSQQSQRLFNETQRAEGKATITNSKGREMRVNQKYSGATGSIKDLTKAESIHRYLDENRNHTLNTTLHIHERHDEKKGEVHLHITDRRAGGSAKHSHHIQLQRPSGNDVNKAEMKLAAILKEMKADQK